jgi:hypothetical protein
VKRKDFVMASVRIATPTPAEEKVSKGFAAPGM